MYLTVDAAVIYTEYDSSVDFKLLCDVSEIVGFNIVYAEMIEEGQMNILNERIRVFFDKTIIFLPKGGIIFNLFRSKSDVKYFHEIYSELTDDLFTLFYFIYYPELKIENAYFISPLLNQGTDFFSRETVERLLGNDIVLTMRDSMYPLSLLILHLGYKVARIHDIDLIRQSIYEEKLITYFGTTWITSDNGISYKKYLYTLDSSGAIREVAFNGLHDRSYPFYDLVNTDLKMECDYSITGKGDVYLSPCMNVGILLEKDRDFLFNRNSLITTYLATLRYINDEFNGILGVKLNPIFITTFSGYIGSSQFSSIIMKYSINHFFGLTNFERFNDIMEYCKANNKLFMYPGDYKDFDVISGVEINNVMFSGFSLSNLKKLGTHIQSFDQVKDIVVLYSKSKLYEDFIETIVETFKFYNLNFISFQYFNYDKAYWDNTVNRIVAVLKDGGMILSLLSHDLYSSFMKNIYRSDLRLPKYVVISYELPRDIHENSYLYEGQYFYQSGIVLESEISQKMNFYLKEVYSYQFVIDHFNLHTINSMLFWRSVVLECGSFKINSILKRAKNIEFDSPMGLMTSRSSADLFNPLYLLQYNTSFTERDHLKVIFYSETADFMYYQNSASTNNTLSHRGSESKIKMFLFVRKNLEGLDSILNGINAYSTEVNLDNHKMNSILIDVKYYSFDDELTEKLFSEYINRGYRLFVGCDSLKCRNKVSKYISNAGVLLYPYSIYGEECNFNIIYTGIVGSQIERALNAIADTVIHNYKVFLLISSNEDFKNYEKMFMELSVSFLEVIGIIRKDDNDIFTFSDFDYFISRSSGGCILLSSFHNVILTEFLNYYVKNNFRDNLYRIINTRFGYGDVKDSDLHLYENVYFIESYTKLNDSFILKFDHSMKKYTSAKRNSDISFNIYSALSLYGLTVERYPNLSENDLIDKLPSVKDLVQDYDFFITEGHYIKRRIYITRMKNGVEESLFSINQYPYVYSWLWFENIGLMCVAKPDNLNEVERIAAYYVFILTSLTGGNRDENLGVFSTVFFLLESLRSNFSLELFPLPFDDQSAREKCQEILLTIVSQSTAIIMTTSDDNCLLLEMDSILKQKSIVAKFGTFAGEMCISNVYFAGIDPSRVYEPVEMSLMMGKDKFLLIGPTDLFGSYFNIYASNLIKSMYGTVVNSGLFENDVDNITKYIQKSISMTSDGFSIIFFGNRNLFLKLNDALRMYNLNEPLYQLFSLTVHEMGSNIRNYYFFGTYIPSLSNDHLKGKYLYEGAEECHVSQRINDAYTVFSVFLKLLDNTGYDFAKSKKYIYNTSFETPTGLVYVDINNVVQQVSRVGRYILGDNKLSKIHEGIHTRIQIFKRYINDVDYTCDFKGNEGKLKLIRATIATVLPLSGIYSTIGRELLSILSYTINSINIEDRVMARFIILVVRDYGSDLERLSSVARELVDMDDILAIFGGINPEEKKVISEIVEITTKIFFYVGDTSSKYCFKNTFTSGISPYQLVLSTLSVMIHYPGNYIVVYTKREELSKSMNDALTTKFNQIANQYSSIEYANDNQKLKIEIERNCQDRICILFNTISGMETMKIINTINELLDESIISKVIHYFINEYQLNRNLNIFNNHYLIRQFFAEFENFEDKEFVDVSNWVKKHKKITYTSERLYYSHLSESMYYSLYLWINSVELSNSFNSTKVRYNIYNNEARSPIGIVGMNFDGISKRKLYIVQIENEKYKLIDSPEKHIIGRYYLDWIQEQEDLYCDWSSGGSGSNVRYGKTIKVALVLELDDSLRENSFSAYYSMLKLIKDVNLNKGLDNIYVVMRIFFATIEVGKYIKSTNNGNTVRSIMESIFKNNEYKALFACIDINCRKDLIELSVKHKFLTFYLGNSEGEITSRYVMFSGSTIMQKWIVSFNYFKLHYENYYIIINPDSIYLGIIKSIEEMIKSDNSVNLIAKVIPEDKSRMYYAVRNINKLMDSIKNLVGKMY